MRLKTLKGNPSNTDVALQLCECVPLSVTRIMQSCLRMGVGTDPEPLGLGFSVSGLHLAACQEDCLENPPV